ncbi:FAD-NAD(P)-binding-domain-containing protein [Nemania diffusa]|nr:FAD-NAD(P)-binding-domain-containing protein [Nemania diffusa]
MSIAICGGGACGLAVLVSLIKEIQRFSCTCHIYIYEKHSNVGPGLAYSEESSSALINMAAETMGLYEEDPLHFIHWLSQHHPHRQFDRYPPRNVYGDYLLSMFAHAKTEALSSRVHIEEVWREVVGIRLEDDRFAVYDEFDGKRVVDKVILALGNFPMCTQSHLCQSPRYFSSPWPLQRLSTIEKQSSVCILGTRLSAIDTVLYLKEQGHTGHIAMVSRGGRLPSVQCHKSKPFGRAYALEALARNLEKLPHSVSLEKLMVELRSVVDEPDSRYCEDMLEEKNPLHRLEQDIRDAEAGHLPWRSLADSAAPFFERYWQVLDLNDRERFMREWVSVWYSIIHAMPLVNAKRLWQLLSRGEVCVHQFTEIKVTQSSFAVSTARLSFDADYLVEATGQEQNVSRIASPLLLSLISANIMLACPLGGFSVHRETLESKATRGIYAIGSLTSGTHFYTNGIDRNVAHAARIARHISSQINTL